jgi:thioesterase domain-containing protein
MDEKNPARDDHLGWTKVLPEDQVRVLPVPGTHYSMIEAPQTEVIGKSLSDALRQASLSVG